MHPNIKEHSRPQQPSNLLHPQLEHQNKPPSSPKISKSIKTTLKEPLNHKKPCTPNPNPHPQTTPQPLTPPFPRCTWTTQLLTTRNGRTTTKITVMVDCGKAYCFTSARFDRFQQHQQQQRQHHQGQHTSSSCRHSSRHSSSSSGSRAQHSDGSSSRSSSSLRRRGQGGWRPWGF